MSIFMNHKSLQSLLDGCANKKDKLYLYKEGINIPIDINCEYSKWQFWDQCSLFAYYEKEYDLAFKSYEKLITLGMYPEKEKERIFNNGKYFDVLNPSNALNHSLFIKTLQAEKNNIKGKIKYRGIIPDIIHFIYLKGYEFGLHHYIAIKSADIVMKWSTIYLYNDIEPENNIWWNLTKKIESVKIIKIHPPTVINKNIITYKQHIADLMRLEILKLFGGVYFDLDMLTHKDFSNLLSQINMSNQLMMCKETDTRINNAMIACVPDCDFIAHWLNEYYTSYGNEDLDTWGGLSVMKPFELLQLFPNTIILDTPTFLPFDYFHTDFFKNNNNSISFDNSFGIHLWDTEQQKRGILPASIDELENSKSKFWYLFKYLLEEDKMYIELTQMKYKIKELEEQIKKLTKN